MNSSSLPLVDLTNRTVSVAAYRTDEADMSGADETLFALHSSGTDAFSRRWQAVCRSSRLSSHKWIWRVWPVRWNVTAWRTANILKRLTRSRRSSSKKCRTTSSTASRCITGARTDGQIRALFRRLERKGRRRHGLLHKKAVHALTAKKAIGSGNTRPSRTGNIERRTPNIEHRMNSRRPVASNSMFRVRCWMLDVSSPTRRPGARRSIKDNLNLSARGGD